MRLSRLVATAGPVVLTVSLLALAPSEQAPADPPALAPGAFAVADEDSFRRSPARNALPVPAEPPASAGSLAQTDLALLETDDGGVPVRVLAAYRAAADRLRADQPGCRLRWELLAGIGRIESDHGRYGGAVLLESGRVEPAILGPRLDGSGPFAVIRDTDAGRYDGDPAFDRAVGPMQFIPGTWSRWGADADGDGADDPQDVDDAALAAGRYLCASGRRLDSPANIVAAVFSYNHSYDYVRAVLTVAARYAKVSPLAFGTGLLPGPTPSPTPSAVPPVEAGEPAPLPAVVPVAATPARTTGPTSAPTAGMPAEPTSGSSPAPTADPDPTTPMPCPTDATTEDQTTCASPPSGPAPEH